MKLYRFNQKPTHDTYTLKYILWYLVSAFFFDTIIPGNKIRVILLKLFSAKVGKNTLIKPNVKIKYPWKLSIGDYSWIGENVWIDNISNVTIGKNSCISQGVYICSGSHDFFSKDFSLLMQEVHVGSNCWVAAKSIISPGSIIKDNTFVKFGSIVIRHKIIKQTVKKFK
jgi:putative colanic acid biosynthesis acetyltransferase WcaF